MSATYIFDIVVCWASGETTWQPLLCFPDNACDRDVREAASLHGRAGSWLMINQRKQYTMIEYIKTWLELKTDRRAVTALEYGVIAGVLAVVVVTAFNTLGVGLNTAFTHVATQL
jgi:pilus assembly protein Flp/PilA